MLTKAVYVLSSDLEDFYFEQLAVSATSLAAHNPEARIEIVCDRVTYDVLIGPRREALPFVQKWHVVNLNSQLSKKAKSRWLKTSLREIIEGGFIYIDTDTVITGNLSDIDKQRGIVGAVKDMHQKDRGYNGGVIWMRDCEDAHEFCNEWHRQWEKTRTQSDCTDQPALARVIAQSKEIVTELDPGWNYQIGHIGTIKEPIRIMHYYYGAAKSVRAQTDQVLSWVRALNYDSEFMKAAAAMLVSIKMGTYGKELDWMSSKSFYAFTASKRCFTALERITEIYCAASKL
ncbi:MAG: hypothetical protein LIP03_04625 [Bacteroidales bacterium]|nr:hypothetical protein [Bacteroidales bacterium]